MVARPAEPSLREVKGDSGVGTIAASHAALGNYSLHCEGNPRLLFTENDTNNERLFGTPNAMPYVKDGINNYVVSGGQDAVNPNRTGTKAAAHYQLNVGAGATSMIRLRLSDAAVADPFGSQFDQIIEQRRHEADAFYQAITPARASAAWRASRSGRNGHRLRPACSAAAVVSSRSWL
jgi:hypothetical protein